jgi:hypothetical protein
MINGRLLIKENVLSGCKGINVIMIRITTQIRMCNNILINFLYINSSFKTQIITELQLSKLIYTIDRQSDVPTDSRHLF